MAEKKYLDLTGLGQYDAKIKALIDSKDAATLASAKAHAEGLASNYDASGAAATAEGNAKSYTDGKVSELNQTIAGVKTTAEKGVADAATAQAAADAAQGEVDALETLVGTLPEGSTVTNVVAYIDKKTEGIASEGAMTELSGRVTTVEGKVSTIEGDYLKAADKTELEGKITAEAEAREAADDAIDERLVEVEAFFKLAEGEQLDTALDTLKEIQTYITTEGAAADQMVLDIAANAKAIEDEVARATKAEGDIETAYKAADSAQVERIAALEAKFTGEDSVADQIADAVAAEAQLREEGDATLQEAIDGAVADAAAAQGEVDALEEVVAELTETVGTKASQEGLTNAMNRIDSNHNRLQTLEAATHTHSNKEVLDGITAALVADWNDAVAKEHEHANKDVLDGITSTLVANWNAAEGNAKSYTDEKIAEFVAIQTSEIDALFTA